MTRRKAVPILRTRRKGEKIYTSSGEHTVYDGATFVERLKTLNRTGVIDLPRARKR